MSEERKTVPVGIAEKGTPPDDAEITVLAKPEEDEVGGRANRPALVQCPYCCTVHSIIEDTERQKWFNCWNCSLVFLY